MLTAHRLIDQEPHYRDYKIFVVDNNEAIQQARINLLSSPDSLKELSRLPYKKMIIELTNNADFKDCCYVFEEIEGEGRRCFMINFAYFINDEDGVILEDNALVYPETVHGSAKDGLYVDIRHDGGNGSYIAQCAVGLMAQIGLINSKQITDDVIKPTQHFLNKKRIRNGNPPITEYHVIKLKPEIERQFKESEKNAASGKMPFHWRRGHFKALPCGLRWWNAHTVGKKENGEVISGYLLEGA
jgi:hypothetical protein